MSGQTNKNLTIETLRGISIFLVVVGHVIGSTPEGGMKIDFPSPWRYLYMCRAYAQMPLFIAIAGWVYAYKPVAGRSWTDFMFNKFKRLLIPMAAVGTLYFIVQYITPGTNTKGDFSSIWHIYLFPYTMYWYLQSLFLIFAVVAIADKLSLIGTVRNWLITLSISIALYIVQVVFIAGNAPNYFSFQGALVLLPYFLTGLGIMRFGKMIYPSTALYIVLAAIGVILLQMSWFYPESINSNLYQSLMPLWLVPTLVLIFNIKFTSKAFIFLGTYAYSIYLFHGFGTSGGRIILSYFGIHSNLIVFLFATTIALAAPIVLDTILSKNRYTRMMFLGKRF